MKILAIVALNGDIVGLEMHGVAAVTHAGFVCEGKPDLFVADVDHLDGMVWYVFCHLIVADLDM